MSSQGHWHGGRGGRARARNTSRVSPGDAYARSLADPVVGELLKVKIVIAELFGAEKLQTKRPKCPCLPSQLDTTLSSVRTLGLRIESRVVTAFTKEEASLHLLFCEAAMAQTAEAVRLGWRLGDCILAVGRQRVPTQADDRICSIRSLVQSVEEALLAGISGCKEACNPPIVGCRFD